MHNRRSDADRLIALSEIPGLGIIPQRRRGARIHTSTIVRWIRKGVKGTRLRAVRAGGSWATTRAWLDEFFAACAAQELGSLQPPSANAAHEAAEAELRAMGVLQ